MTQSVPLNQAISLQIRKYRQVKGLSIKALAEECERLGAKGLTAASLANIERGQSEEVERGQRRVNVGELAVIAKALGVPPIVLIFPVDTAATVEITPGHEMATWDAVRWFTAEGPISPDNIDRSYGPGQYDPEAGKYGYGRRDPVTGLYEWYQPADEAAWERGAAPVLIMRQLAERVREWLDRAPYAGDPEKHQMLAAIRSILGEMRRRGMPAPALPAGLADIEDPGKGVADRGRSDQED